MDKSVKFLHLNICYVIYVLLWIKYWLMWFTSLLVFILFNKKCFYNSAQQKCMVLYVHSLVNVCLCVLKFDCDDVCFLVFLSEWTWIWFSTSGWGSVERESESDGSICFLKLMCLVVLSIALDLLLILLCGLYCGTLSPKFSYAFFRIHSPKNLSRTETLHNESDAY